ncbi:hypothetical protein N7450_002580 [Penicillium hetheringtonii]|uniref:Uncharacterized protein n=1 Tax=Penicillium hetheringtonii TaxID=911720 RepID=A0AAD6DXL5_9EURO|nr:hypothetical protein N7450_002580 [Penicillium hetheringtonii]
MTGTAKVRGKKKNKEEKLNPSTPVEPPGFDNNDRHRRSWEGEVEKPPGHNRPQPKLKSE